MLPYRKTAINELLSVSDSYVNSSLCFYSIIITMKGVYNNRR